MKIVLLENLGVSPEKIEEEKKKLDEMGHSLEVYERTSDLDTLKKETENAEVILLANMPLPAEVIEADPNLRYIDVAFTGVDHVPMALVKEKGIALSNASGYATDAVAELAIAMTIDRLRHIEELEVRARDGQTKAGIRGNLLKGKTVGIVGCGAIGKQTARLFKAFGCKILGYNRSEVKDPVIDQQVDLDTLMKESDVVSVHVPLTDQTRHLIDKEHLEMMKPSAILINTARGPVVDEDALAQLLEQGKLAGAGIDVFDKEPPLDPNLPILNAPNTTVTPHMGFDSVESMEMRFEIVFDNLYGWLEGKALNRIC